MEVIEFLKNWMRKLSIESSSVYCFIFLLAPTYSWAQFYCPQRIKISQGVYSILAKEGLNYLEYSFCASLMSVDLKKPFKSSGIPFSRMNFEGARFKQSFDNEVDIVLRSQSMLLDNGHYKVVSTDNGEVPFQHKNLDFDYKYDSGLILIPPYRRRAEKSTFELSHSYLEKSLDWEAILELDQMAKKAWDDYVFEMNKKGVYESGALREHYFNKGYKNKIFDNFRHSLVIFMESSTVSVTYGLSMLENFHPFFVQTLLEFSIYSQYRLRYGLNPSAIFNKAFTERASIGQDEGLVSYTFLLLNIVTANDKSCLNFGLSPEYSRSLVEYRDFLDHDILDHIVSSYKYNTSKNCGSFYEHKFYEINELDQTRGVLHQKMGKIIFNKFEEIGNYILKKYH
ncbi:hypothetical protein M899_1711 [Bacteriovorax sp. BSW11_IV]|uniref:hypothetical protein n=1 Tax=Bacteriovorax sp. BSW11_IV TaxID=1353529 RepID=UPI00038A206F|nr:hypothetical protein [Bacteriovorax sp. BSW11_IV]EQC49279.1 hypothetical protein M899_1711 [Bacteriovorax sp. BSW11_IV]